MHMLGALLRYPLRYSLKVLLNTFRSFLAAALNYTQAYALLTGALYN